MFKRRNTLFLLHRGVKLRDWEAERTYKNSFLKVLISLVITLPKCSTFLVSSCNFNLYVE